MIVLVWFLCAILIVFIDQQYLPKNPEPFSYNKTFMHADFFSFSYSIATYITYNYWLPVEMFILAPSFQTAKMTWQINL